MSNTLIEQSTRTNIRWLLNQENKRRKRPSGSGSTPVAGNPDPAFAVSGPIAIHPLDVRGGPQNPIAFFPSPGACPCPVTADPNVALPRLFRHQLQLGRRRCFLHNNGAGPGFLGSASRLRSRPFGAGYIGIRDRLDRFRRFACRRCVGLRQGRSDAAWSRWLPLPPRA